MLSKKLAVDLGTSTTRVVVRVDGSMFEEPSVVATTAEGDHTVATGTAALARAGRDGAVLRRPLHAGAVADAVALEALVTAAITRVTGRQRIFKPDVMVTVTPAMSGADRRLIMEIATRAGARTCYLIDLPLAAAVGCGLPITGNTGHLVVDVGGGTTDIAVIALEGTVARATLPEGGADLTDAIARHVQETRGLRLETRWAEEVKREIGSAVPLHEERVISVPARRPGDDEDVQLPLSSLEVAEVVREPLRRLASALSDVLADTPRVLIADLRRDGGVACGGGARLRGMDRLLAATAGLPVRLASDPEGCTARGAASALENLDVMRRHFLYIR